VIERFGVLHTREKRVQNDKERLLNYFQEKKKNIVEYGRLRTLS
jgi:hypothetical protein